MSEEELAALEKKKRGGGSWWGSFWGGASTKKEEGDLALQDLTSSFGDEAANTVSFFSVVCMEVEARKIGERRSGTLCRSPSNEKQRCVV